MDRIGVCAIFKNEAPFLLEWIAFHKMIGVDHFVLYNNGSDDDGAARIAASPFAPNVTLVDWPERPGQQSAYRDFISNHAKSFTWVAFIDLDEFIHPLHANSLRDVLRDPRYARFSSILLNWLMFGPSGHERRPDRLVIEAYTRRTPIADHGNRHVKTLARTAHLLGVGETPHVFPLQGPSCDAQGTEIPCHAIQESVCHNVMILNHYYTRSRQDWEIKLLRGRADAPDDAAVQYHMGIFDMMAANATEEDTRMSRFVPRLRWLLR